MIWENMLRCFSLGSDVLLVTSLLVVTQLSALASSVSAPQLKEKLFSLLPLNDVLFTENVILGVSAMSRIDCSKKCVETRGCVMWTFHPSTRGPPAVCRLHRLLAGSADAKRAMSGAVTFALQQSCAEGYVVRCGRCLKPVDQHVEYSEAASRCRLSQGQVFMPKTQGEVTCAHQLLLEFGVVKAWLGASDRVSARVFRWNDGTLLPGSSPLWSTLSGDPENSNPGNDCVFIYNTEAKIRDHHCTSDRAYICQREAM